MVAQMGLVLQGCSIGWLMDGIPGLVAACPDTNGLAHRNTQTQKRQQQQQQRAETRPRAIMWGVGVVKGWRCCRPRLPALNALACLGYVVRDSPHMEHTVAYRSSLLNVQDGQDQNSCAPVVAQPGQHRLLCLTTMRVATSFWSSRLPPHFTGQTPVTQLIDAYLFTLF